jgi:hypothetical protein
MGDAYPLLSCWRLPTVEDSVQVDGQHLTNVVDVIDFGGLFSGDAIGPSRGVRPLEAKPEKIIVAIHAAIPSSWKTPRMFS